MVLIADTINLLSYKMDGDGEQTFMYRLNILSSYQTAVLLMGVLTLEFLTAYFIGMILTRSNNWKMSCLSLLKENHGMYFFNVVCMDYYMYNAFE